MSYCDFKSVGIKLLICFLNKKYQVKNLKNEYTGTQDVDII